MSANDGGDEVRLIQFARLVKGMREQQVRFFGGDRSAARIKLSRDYERRVDATIAGILGSAGQQRELFPARDKRPGAYDEPRE